MFKPYDSAHCQEQRQQDARCMNCTLNRVGAMNVAPNGVSPVEKGQPFNLLDLGETRVRARRLDADPVGLGELVLREELELRSLQRALLLDPGLTHGRVSRRVVAPIARPQKPACESRFYRMRNVASCALLGLRVNGLFMANEK